MRRWVFRCGSCSREWELHVATAAVPHDESCPFCGETEDTDGWAESAPPRREAG